jgi:hypothetical protein
MKIKSDFVTNSSSTAYIVAFEETPEDTPETKKMLFGGLEEVEDYGNGEMARTIDLAQIVFQDIQKQNPIDEERATIELYDSWFDENGMIDQIRDGIGEMNDEDTKRTWAFVREEIGEIVSDFFKLNNGKDIYYFEYGNDAPSKFRADNYKGRGEVIERNKLLRRLPHLAGSKH